MLFIYFFYLSDWNKFIKNVNYLTFYIREWFEYIQLKSKMKIKIKHRKLC